MKRVFELEFPSYTTISPGESNHLSAIKNNEEP